MVKINFENNVTKANADTFNTLQDNIEDAINNVSIDLDDEVSTESTNGVENQAITNYVNTKGITESGSNANGSYIKFDDGTMICYATLPFAMNITGQFEGIYYANTGAITFPQEFYETPTINVTIRGVAGGGYSFYTPTKSDFSGFIWKIQSKSNVDLYVMYFAIGRWK